MLYWVKVRNRTLIYIAIAAFVVRLIAIGQSLWLDEATSALVVRDINLFEILQAFSPADFHPPLYYLVLKVWSWVFGTGEVALRILSVLFGVATVIVTYKIAELYNKGKLPVIAGILMATAPLHIYYSQEARMYAMTAFFVSLSAYFLLLTKKRLSPIYVVATGAWAGLAFLTDYMAVFFIPVIWLIWLLDKKLRKERLLFLIINLPLIFAALAILPLFIQQFSNALGVKASGSLWWNILGAFSIKNIFLVPTKFIIGRISFDNNLIYGLYAGTALSVFGFLIFNAWRDKKKYLTLFLWLKLPVFLAIIVSLVIPVLYYFRLLFVLPALYILLAIGLLKIRGKYFLPVLGMVLGINILSSSIYLLNGNFHREDWEGMVEHISGKSENAQVVFVADSQMEAFDYYSGGIERVSPENINLDSDKIWLMRYVQDIYDPEDIVRRKVEEVGFVKNAEHNFNGVVVYEYENSN